MKKKTKEFSNVFSKNDKLREKQLEQVLEAMIASGEVVIVGYKDGQPLYGLSKTHKPVLN